jgi:hypothetical protein
MWRVNKLNALIQTAMALLAGTSCLAIVVWTAGGLFYDVGRGTRLGGLLTVVWVGAVAASFVFWHPPWKPLLLVVGLFAVFLSWWYSQRPSHDRRWHPLATRLARVVIKDDSVTIENIRNAQYESFTDGTPCYESRSYRLSNLRGVDALICFWGSRWMCHPMFVFDFGADGRVCMSVEVRYRVGQDYSFLRSMYRQQELIYIVCDERDAILRRTKHAEGQNVYLYRMSMPLDDIREAFHEYAESINHLYTTPRWYHGFTNNCTTSVYAQRRRRMKWDWRLIVNGALDKLLYERERLDQSLPFATLKQQSITNDIANSAPVDGFGDYLRRQLPGYQHSLQSHPDVQA